MVTSVLFNITVQCAICIFVVFLSLGQERELNESTRDAAKVWHDQASADTVRRVCTKDFTLSTDYRQAHAFDVYDSYIQQNSSLLCLAMLLVWIVACFLREKMLR